MLLSFETYWKHPNLESIFLLFYDNLTQHTLTHAYTQTHTHTDRQTAVVWKKVNGKKLLVSKQQQQKHSVEQQQV